MQEIIEQIWSYVRGVWRFRWWIYVLAWPICLAGWLFVHQMPDSYDAKARVFVDTSSKLKPLLRGLAAQTSGDAGLNMMTRTLLSRPNLEKIIRMTDMDLGVSNPEELDALVTKLSRTIRFSGRKRDKLYTIRYTDKDPVLAKNIVQAMLTLFVESTLGGDRKNSGDALQFIESQVAEYEQKLVEADNRLKEFKQKNIGLMPGEGRGYYAQMKSAKSQLAAAQLELIEAQNLRDELNRQIRGEEPVFGLVPSGSNSGNRVSAHPLDSRINTLESKMDDLLLKYTSKHPDVIATQQTLNRLLQKREKELNEFGSSLPKVRSTNPLNQNPVYQQLRISLSRAEAKVSSLKPRVIEYKEKVVKLESLVDTIPQIEVDLKNLNRDYAINKKNYDALLARRESAKMAEKVESSVDGVKFKIIDPPRVPPHPSGPNRRLFESVVLIGGLVAGLAFAFLLSQVKPMFDTAKKLQAEMKLPVLGYVSRVWTPVEQKKRKLDIIYFGLVGVLLLVVFGGVLTLEATGIRLLL